MARKKQKLQSAEYILLSASYKDWLTLLGYSSLSIPVLTLAVTDFLQYQEQQGRVSLGELKASDANDFIEVVQRERNCSNGHVNKLVQALKLFSRYLRETGRSNTGLNLQRLEETRSKPVWLTKAEIQSLYNSTDDNVLGIRDRAMLAVFYGCGLRLNEGASLELTDIDRAKKIVHVRKGKQYKERLIPVAEKSYEAILFYIDYGRPQLLQEIKTESLFIDANKGRRMQKQSLYVRIKSLVKKAGIKKRVGTHTLRHSIATHLLQSGMKLERIQQFLGHSSLDSTQIYTHLKNESL
jgi:site-specific recombinase XerD